MTIEIGPEGLKNLSELSELMDEQADNAKARALKDPGKTSATWIAKGDQMILLIVEAQNSAAIKKTFYKCHVLKKVVQP